MVTTRRRFLAGGARAGAAAISLACAGTPAGAFFADRFRVFCSCNPMPVHSDPEGDKYMFEKYGFEPMALCDWGTLNRVGVFVGDDGNDLRELRWDREDADRGSPTAPQHEWAVREYARRCRGLANRYKKHLPASVPIYFNLETGPWSLDVWHGPEPEKKLDAIMENWLKVIRAAKQATGGSCPVSAYMLPVPYNGERAQEVAREVAYAMPTLYMIDEYLPNPNLWFDAVDRAAADLDRAFPWLPKVAVINPTWQVYRDPVQQAKWNAKPIGMPLWVRMLKHLADRGWNGALCWWGLTPLNDQTKPYLRELDAMQR
jgi:hypothetical protein